MLSTQPVYVHMNGMHTRITAIADGIIRITHTLQPDFRPGHGPCVTDTTPFAAGVSESDSEYSLTAGCVTLRLSKATGAISLWNPEGQLLLREPDRRPRVLEEKPVYINHFSDGDAVREGQGADGARAWATPSETRLDRMAHQCRQNFVFDEDEALYGLGSHEEGLGNLRGSHRLLYQHNMKAVVPVLVSTKGWGALFDMGCLMAFHDDESGSCLWADHADELDWYFLYGDGSNALLMERHRLLTGETPMLPKYALGYIQSKERYQDAEEMIAVAREYRRRRIPLDMIVLDWQSWPDNQWGWKTFDPERFPDPEALTDTLHGMDVKMMISIWPSMQGEKNADRAEMLAAGCMLGNRLIYNAFDPAARAIYWRQANENLFSRGVDAWWCDCSEPFESDWHGAIKPEPFLRARMNTDEAKQYLDPTQINLYSLYHAMGIYQGQRQTTGEKRVCNLTRSSYAGQHRYGTITWSGDVSANWETLRRHIPEGLNFCAAGEAFWSTDIGAFFPNGNWDPWFYEGDFDRGVEDPGYRELFVRWMQYGAFLPMMRAHGTGTPREIWQFGEPGEPFYDAIAKAIRLRYRLIPFLYSLMAHTHAAGQPMLRTPALVFPHDRVLRSRNDLMLLGDNLLIRPVTRPMKWFPYGAVAEHPDETELVYLPAGADWYDLNTGRCYTGGQTVTVYAPLDTIPLFVRAGTILPWAAPVQSTAGLTGQLPELVVFPGQDGDFLLYDDAGDGYGYEQGEFIQIPLHWDDARSTLTVGARQGRCPGFADPHSLRVCIFRQESQTHRYTGEPLEIPLQQN